MRILIRAVVVAIVNFGIGLLDGCWYYEKSDKKELEGEDEVFYKLFDVFANINNRLSQFVVNRDNNKREKLINKIERTKEKLMHMENELKDIDQGYGE